MDSFFLAQSDDNVLRPRDEEEVYCRLHKAAVNSNLSISSESIERRQLLRKSFGNNYSLMIMRYCTEVQLKVYKPLCSKQFKGFFVMSELRMSKPFFVRFFVDFQNYFQIP